MTELTLEHIVNQVDDMTVLPSVINKIISLSNDPDSTIKDMENVILADQTLTSKVLKLANSAYYGYARRISTISQATILLGFDTIKSMAIASTVSSMMAGEFKGYALDSNDLWIQSQTCALISRHIARKTKFHDPEEAYIAGLLRDIGKTILNKYMVDDYTKVLELVLDEKISFSDAETRYFGFDHSAVGAEVAKKWNLPENLVDAIKHHHNPSNSENDDIRLVSIVHIADAMTMMMGVGLGLDGLTYSLSQKSLDVLNIDIDTFKEIISESADLLRDQDSFFLSN